VPAAHRPVVKRAARARVSRPLAALPFPHSDLSIGRFKLRMGHPCPIRKLKNISLICIELQRRRRFLLDPMSIGDGCDALPQSSAAVRRRQKCPPVIENSTLGQASPRAFWDLLFGSEEIGPSGRSAHSVTNPMSFLLTNTRPTTSEGSFRISMKVATSIRTAHS